MKNFKKIIALLLAIVVVFAFCSCGNMSLGVGNFDFKGVHICDYAGNAVDKKVEKWYDNGSEGIEVKLKDGNSIYLSEGSYILYEDECPICSK